jgi:hypothetical protein
MLHILTTVAVAADRRRIGVREIVVVAAGFYPHFGERAGAEPPRAELPA